jgi:hypothetical protein
LQSGLNAVYITYSHTDFLGGGAVTRGTSSAVTINPGATSWATGSIFFDPATDTSTIDNYVYGSWTVSDIPSPVDGSCGSGNGLIYSSEPTIELLCSTENSSDVFDTGTT